MIQGKVREESVAIQTLHDRSSAAWIGYIVLSAVTIALFFLAWDQTHELTLWTFFYFFVGLFGLLVNVLLIHAVFGVRQDYRGIRERRQTGSND